MHAAVNTLAGFSQLEPSVRMAAAYRGKTGLAGAASRIASSCRTHTTRANAIVKAGTFRSPASITPGKSVTTKGRSFARYVIRWVGSYICRVPKNANESFNWGWVLGTVGAGVLLIAAGIVSELEWGWESVIAGTLTSVGSTFLLAFVIFVMERRFTRTVARRVEESTRQFVQAETRALTSRLDDLEADLKRRREATRETQRQYVDAITEDISYDTLSSALQEASRVGAIVDGLTVSGSPKMPSVLATFSWATRQLTRGDGLVLDDGSTHHLNVRVVLQKRPGDFGVPQYEHDWQEEERPVEVAEALEQQLRQGGRLAEAKVFDFGFALSNLQAGLRLAMEEQHAAPGEERLRGQLREVLQDGWVVTTEGIQNLGTGFMASGDGLGFKRSSSVFGPGWSISHGYEKPAPPEGIPLLQWELVVERACQTIAREFYF